MGCIIGYLYNTMNGLCYNATHMEPQAESPVEVSPNPAPINDVLPPAPTTSPEPEPMATPPAELDPPANLPTETPPENPPASTKPAAVNKPPKPKRSGTTAAIVSTVIIVIALAGLAVYAYLKQKS
jgi:hypothetical protein